MLLLGRKTAAEKVASFLLLMCEQQAGNDTETIDLPMGRGDIADYLGLTIETVSRTFTQLQASGLIDLPSRRRVVLRDLDAMDRICA